MHHCEQALDGSLDCWGANYWGMLGDGTLNTSTTPVVVGGGTPYASFVAYRINSCALTSDGRVQCWGAGASGQNGTGSTQDALVPTDVSGGHTFTALASSGNADFACALSDKGHAYCWGHGDFGQLGDGAFVSRNEPVLVQFIGSTP